MTELASSADFVVRPATDDDLNYVRKTWLQEHAQNSDWIDNVGGGDVYFAEHARCRDAAIDHGAVTIACRPAMPSGICGFAVTAERECSTRIIHFVFVKKRWRGLGAAKLLLSPFANKPTTFTHRMRTLRKVPDAWTFNPYPFLRSQ